MKKTTIGLTNILKSSKTTNTDKVRFPQVGFGTYKLGGELLESLVEHAIKVGYRHIDTASAYRNEKFIGNALHRCIHELKVVKREELFITSKLGPKQQGYSKAKSAVEKSLVDLRLDYIDLYLSMYF